MELASQIRRRRIERGLSQDDLAAAVFVSRQTVSNWENDKTYPDVQSLLLLSRLFDTSIDELLEGDVAVMRHAVKEDAKKMRLLGAAAVLFVALAVAFFVALAAAWREPSPFGGLSKGDVAGLAVFAPLYGLSLAAVFGIERIKHRHDLVAYHEILAFANGESIDAERTGHRFARSHPVMARIIKFGFAAILGAALGLTLYKLIG